MTVLGSPNAMIATLLSWCWLGLGLLVLGVWTARMVLLGQAIRGRTILEEQRATSLSSRLPRVSVLVAAKDEQANIETCVRTLLEQDFPSFEVIVADDRSSDRTPAILGMLQQEFPTRLEVVTIRSVEAGWFGKCHAMRAAVRAASPDSEWLLMTDADCRFVSPLALRCGVEEALATGSDFLTVIPQLDAPTWWERLVQPVCALVLMYWFQPQRVNDPKQKTAYANGAYMLVRRRCYSAIGGHEAVRDQLNEDIQLARAAKASGWRLRVVENEGLYRTRMYATFGQAHRGWSRIFSGALRSPSKVALAAGLVFTFAFLPLVATVACAFPFVRATHEGGAPLAAWAAALLAEHVVVWRLYAMMKVGRAWSLLYPAGAIAGVCMLLSAMLKSFGATSTTWRDTTYRAGKALPPAPAPEAPGLCPDEV
jgi:chlorobactene glucosyltransferase